MTVQPNQIIVVPRISSVPGREARARRLLRWLVERRIVEALPTTCGRGARTMAYAIGDGARQVVEHPERLPFGQAVNGLEIVTERCIYTPTRDFAEEAGCPECRREIGTVLFDSLEVWMPGETDNFTCPECGFEDDINGFLFIPACAFSDLAFVFNGWADAGFVPAFVEAFAERLGFPCAQVRVDG
ncbi:sugar ABC transporter ATPase [Stutzerimonas stutzeri]|nr:sugar ABC transporter ATPase [Stutzerimonas stutzeri]